MKTNFKNNQNISRKTLLFSIAFLTLLASLTSCTVDHLPDEKQVSGSSKVGDINPPTYPERPRM